MLQKILYLENWNFSSLIQILLYPTTSKKVKSCSSLLFKSYWLNRKNKKWNSLSFFVFSVNFVLLNPSSNWTENIYKNYSKVQKYFIWGIKIWTEDRKDESLPLEDCIIFSQTVKVDDFYFSSTKVNMSFVGKDFEILLHCFLLACRFFLD